MICPRCGRKVCDCLLEDPAYLARQVGKLMRTSGGKAGSPATRNEYVVGTEPSPAKRDRVADVRLWNCDCLDVMSGLKDKEIPITLTSVPFRKEDVPGDYWETYDRWIREIRRCSEVALIVQSATTLVEHVRRYPPRRVLVWGKTGWCMFSYRFNPIYVYSDLPVDKHIWTDLIGVPTLGNPSERCHKYQDPLELYKLLLGMWKDVDLVFDPFMGSGTCGIAARHYRMDFWGTEIDPAHYETACKRLEYEPEAKDDSATLHDGRPQETKS
jgi:hypothetical protein